MCWNEWKNFNKFYVSRSLACNNQSITRFDCHKAVCLPDDVKECLWIQEVTGEVWISLKQNIINTAVNECGKRLYACVHTVCPYFKQFCCRQLKNETVWWNVSQSVKKVNEICFCALFRLSNNTALGKKAIFRWFWFPQVVHKQILGEVGNWTFIWWQVVSGIFPPKIIKIQ